MRLLRTEFVERWEERSSEIQADPSALLAEIAAADEAGDRELLLVVGGQSAGLIQQVEPAADIVRALVDEARATLGAASAIELLARSRATACSRPHPTR